MIKINLLRNLGLTKGAGIAVEGGPAEAVTPDSIKTGVTKLVTIVLFPLVLFVYEKINLSEIEGRQVALHGKLEALRGERQGFGDAGPKIEKYNKEKQRIDKELEIVRELARNRLRELKALDAIQTLMPDKTWAKTLVFAGNAVKMIGFSSVEDGPTQVLRSLESNVFFSKVEPKETSTEQNQQGGTLKKFEIDFHIGKAE